MIRSAEEFVALRTSSERPEYHRAAHEDAPEAVWRDVIARFPEMRIWVAQNKTVPLAILEVLADDVDERVRLMVAQKRKLSRKLFELLAGDAAASVRRAVAFNASAPADLLARLAADPDPAVADAARSRLAPRAT